MGYTLYVDEERAIPSNKDGTYPELKITFTVNGQEITETWKEGRSITHKWLRIEDLDGCADWLDRYFLHHLFNDECTDEIDPECLPKLEDCCKRMLIDGEPAEEVIGKALNTEIAGQFDYSSPAFWKTVRDVYDAIKGISRTRYNVDMAYHYYAV